MKVAVVGVRGQVGGVGKRRNPFAVDSLGVPADVVVVDVGVDDDVHLGGVDLRRLQMAQEVGMEVRELGSLGAVPIVANPCVHHDGEAAGSHHPGLYCDSPDARRCVKEMGVEPSSVVVQDVSWGIGEHLAERAQGADPLDDPHHLGGAESQTIHAVSLLVNRPWHSAQGTHCRRERPPRPRGPWSKRNVGIHERLIGEGRVRPAGLAEVERARVHRRWDAAYHGSASISVPADLAKALAADPAAALDFDGASAQNRYAILYRLATARRADTRGRRL